MTQEEYQQLLNGSDSFKTMDPETQQSILSAEGPKMEEYITLFNEEKVMLNQAWDKNQQDKDQIIKDFTEKAKQKLHVKLKVDEENEQKKDTDEAEALIKNL